jgi:hypothetical protein
MATNKNCLQGRTCDDKNPAFDYVELTFQVVVDGGTLTASCASLACGYENKAIQASVYAGDYIRKITKIRGRNDKLQSSLFNSVTTITATIGDKSFTLTMRSGKKESLDR